MQKELASRSTAALNIEQLMVTPTRDGSGLVARAYPVDRSFLYNKNTIDSSHLQDPTVSLQMVYKYYTLSCTRPTILGFGNAGR